MLSVWLSCPPKPGTLRFRRGTKASDALTMKLTRRALTLKRKRMDDMIYCYSAIEELGISLDADARVHITLTSTATFVKGRGVETGVLIAEI